MQNNNTTVANVHAEKASSLLSNHNTIQQMNIITFLLQMTLWT